MNAREISEVSLKLKSIINAVEQGGLRNIARELENTVLTPFGMFDVAVMAKMRDSRDSAGHYTIRADDIESIKSIKAVINILRSTDAATNTIIKPVIEGAIDYLVTGSKKEAAKGLLSGAAGATTEYVAAKWNDFTRLVRGEYGDQNGNFAPPTENRIDQGLQLIGDVNALKFYMSQIGSVLPDLTGLSEEAKLTITRLQSALDTTIVMNAASTIQEITNTKTAMGGMLDFANAATKKNSVTGLDRSLEAVKEAAAGAISAEEHAKYYDEKDDKYRLPELNKSGKNLPLPSQNLMIAYNVVDRARKTVARVNEFMNAWDKNKAIPVAQLPAMLELVNKIGKMVKDAQQLDNSQLSQLIKEDMNQAMKQVISALGPNLPQLAAIAQETELRVGLRDNYLLSNLETISKQFEALAKSYNVPVTTQYPYPEQKNEIIQKMKAEALQRVTDLGEVKRNLSGRKYDVLPSMSDLSIMLQQASRIRTPAGAAYVDELNKMINQSTGMDKLEIDINKAETKLYELSQLPASGEKSNHKELVKQELSNVRQLYAMRDQLQSMIDKPGSQEMQHYTTDKFGVGRIETDQYEISVPKSFKVAADKALSDVDGLITAENNLLARLDAVAIKNKAVMGAATSLKQNRLAAMQGMQRSTIATVRGAVAAERKSGRDQSYTNIQKKVNQPDDKELLQTVVNKKKGGVIVQCQTARKTMMDNARNYLSESQFLALNVDNKKNGLYEINQGDGLLAMNIKQVSNVLVRLEGLMGKVNQASAYLAAGGLAYANLPGLLPGVVQEVTALLQEVKAANDTLLQVRESLGNTASAEVREVLNGIMESINRNFPARLFEICTDAETEILSSIDPSYADKTRELFTQAHNFITQANNFVRQDNQPMKPMPATSTPANTEQLPSKVDAGPINAMIGILQKKLEGTPAAAAKLGELYKLSALKDGSNEKNIAGIANALIKLNGSLHAAVKLSDSKGKQGGLDLVRNLYGVYSALNEATPSVLSAMAPQIKALLENFEPIVSKIYASAALTEQTMGLRDKSITASLEQLVTVYSDLASKYGAKLKEPAPYYAAQLELAQKEYERLHERKSVSGANTALLDVQIERLTGAMIDLGERVEGRAERTPARIGRT